MYDSTDSESDEPAPRAKVRVIPASAARSQPRIFYSRSLPLKDCARPRCVARGYCKPDAGLITSMCGNGNRNASRVVRKAKALIRKSLDDNKGLCRWVVLAYNGSAHALPNMLAEIVD